ncbi:MAG: hypothetical protein LBB90_09775 [Tannerella sp.]|jgi:hypothetical protein|nr:hypothetical protein [Tannerella sp.]
MKRWWLAGVLLLGVWFLDLQIERENSLPPVRPVAATTASLTGRKTPTDVEHKLTLLSNELKGRTCVLPRQTSGQGVHHIANKRTLRVEKVLQQFRLRGVNQLRRVSEMISDGQIVNYFTLLCRRGYYIFTLRKLLI